MVRPFYKLELVGTAAKLAGTDGAYTQSVFNGDKVPPGTQLYANVLQTPKCTSCGTTENLHDDFGSGGPYRCSDPECLPF